MSEPTRAVESGGAGPREGDEAPSTGTRAAPGDPAAPSPTDERAAGASLATEEGPGPGVALDPPGAVATTAPPAQPTAPPGAEPVAPPPPEPVAPVPSEAAAAPRPPEAAAAPRPPEAAEAEPPTPPIEEEVSEEPEEGSPAWMMTFGDMMSLLLTFFILLFSMSSVEVEKFQAAAQSLSEALGDANVGILPGGATPVDAPSAPVPMRDQVLDEAMEQIADQLEQFVQENRLEEQVVVSKQSHGVFLRMQDQALFGPGSANIAEESLAIVEQLGAVLEAMDMPVTVSGHTDNVPISSAAFPSNWELSAARAAGVARTLVGRGRSPQAVAVEAYGEHRPVASNDTPGGRAQNRRVELYFSRASVEGTLDGRGELPAPEGDPPEAADPGTADEGGGDPEGGPVEPAGSGS